MPMPKLLQLFLDNQAKPKDFRALRNEGRGEIYLYDAIGDWFGISAEAFNREVRAMEGEIDELHLYINSPGGDVFEARAMATALSQLKVKTVAHIEGLAASAATFLPMVTDEVEMTEGGFFMIHEAWTLTMGNKRDHRQQADLLGKVDDSILDAYAKRTGAKRDDLTAWMEAETWFTAAEAKEHGFITSILETDRRQAAAQWNLAAYHNTPSALTEGPPPEHLYDRAQAERRLALIERH
ncbi:ATP-dependent Clp protease proteolytic subunit 1 [Halomonas sp. THAF5a]|uniref:head maturation protease, ClpP-related n=1 Tax=Halomonas sp. THAF5a TaxID=2587844 RepID=UPI0012A8DB86|nr:head maturation protease, ClpP-related [Halomonas sp. THAF5a]QFU01266.1 ATP-dependent Clp protease proteolytic subunit 1 [Halomonas sp. THAF5a]